VNTESVAEFRARAGSWLAKNVPKIHPTNPVVLERNSEETWKRARELQRRLYDGGFAGFCFPREPTADRGVPFNQVRRNRQEGRGN
jgi:hypothetical protein